MAPSESRVLTILLTDIRNFTDRAAHGSRSDLVGLIEKHKQLVLPALERRGARLVKTIGDAFLVVFNSPTDAVLAGVEVQGALSRFNQGVPGKEKIELRIAINIGEVNIVENDIYGEAVNITARIESVAEAGEVFFTEAVYLAMNKSEVPSSEVGYLQLKGVPEKIRVYKVRRERAVGEAEPAAPGRLEGQGAKAWAVEARPRASRPLVILAVMASAGAVAAGLWYGRGAPKRGVLADTADRPCREETARFCAGERGEARKNCLRAHFAELGPLCARTFAADTADRPCREETARFCAGERGEARKNCLRAHFAELGPLCARTFAADKPPSAGH